MTLIKKYQNSGQLFKLNQSNLYQNLFQTPKTDWELSSYVAQIQQPQIPFQISNSSPYSMGQTITNFQNYNSSLQNTLQQRLDAANTKDGEDLNKFQIRRLKNQKSALEEQSKTLGAGLSNRQSKLISEAANTELPQNSSVIAKIGTAIGGTSGSLNIGTGLMNTITSLTGGNEAMEGPGADKPAVQAVSAGISTAKNIIGKANPIAGAAFAASDMLTNIVGNTDGMTVQDAIFSNIPGLNFINAAFGKRTDSYTKDSEVMARQGSSYESSESDMDEASKKAGKKYGLFSNKARKRANKEIAEAKRQQGIIQDIDRDSQLDFLTQASMSDIYANRYNFNLSGGWNQRMAVGKKGMKIFNTEQISKAKKIIEAQKGTKLPRTIDQLIQYAKEQNPRFIQRMSEPIKYIEFIDDQGNQSVGTHYMGWELDKDGNAIVFSRIMENDSGDLQLYTIEEAINKALKTNNYLKMLPEEAKVFTESPDTTRGYKKGWPEFFNPTKYKQGGKINVIPEGALHARLHHLNIDGITKKGIPVVAKDKNGKLEQQAEIERDEIIINLDTSKELEKLLEEYQSSETKQSRKDELAIEAGKLLVEQILRNTKDNTGLIKSVN